MTVVTEGATPRWRTRLSPRRTTIILTSETASSASGPTGVALAVSHSSELTFALTLRVLTFDRLLPRPFFFDLDACQSMRHGCISQAVIHPLLLEFLLLGLKQLFGHALRAVLGAEAELPEIEAETRRLILKKAGNADLELLYLRLSK